MITAMLGEVARDHGLVDARLLPPITPAVLEHLEADYARHADPRRLRRGLVRALAFAARYEEETGLDVAPILH